MNGGGVHGERGHHAPLEFGSLFSGVGGLDLGLERAGIGIAFQAEVDAFRRAVLAEHWPKVKRFDDVRAVRWKSKEGMAPNGYGAGRHHTWWYDAGAGLDGVAGGSPCQDLSIAGRRAGLAGERSGLFYEFVRVADELVRPDGWVLFENVPGLLSSHGGRDFGIVLRSLGDIGFHDLAWRVLDSRYFGVPQRRRRVFIVARRAAARPDGARAVLLEPESGGGHFAPRGEAPAHIAADAPPRTVGPLQGGDQGSGRRSHRLGADEVAGGQLVASALDRRTGGADENDAQAHHLVDDEWLRTAGSVGGGNYRGGRRSEHDPNLVPAARCVTTSQRWDADTETFITFTKAVDSNGTRAPSRFTAWLDDLAPDGPRDAAIGDAVTVPVAEWIGRRLITTDRKLRELYAS